MQRDRQRKRISTPEGLEAVRREKRDWQRKKRAADPEGVQDRQLRRVYGITLGDLRSMSESQGGACAICGRVPTERLGSRKGLLPDHCHVTGRVRGLLCPTCNVMLGQAKDSPTILRAAIEYLSR